MHSFIEGYGLTLHNWESCAASRVNCSRAVMFSSFGRGIISEHVTDKVIKYLVGGLMNGRNAAREPGVCMLWQGARTQTVDRSVGPTDRTSERGPPTFNSIASLMSL